MLVNSDKKCYCIYRLKVCGECGNLGDYYEYGDLKKKKKVVHFAKAFSF